MKQLKYFTVTCFTKKEMFKTKTGIKSSFWKSLLYLHLQIFQKHWCAMQKHKRNQRSIFSCFISPLFSAYICQGKASTQSTAFIRPSQGLRSLLKLSMNKYITFIQTRFLTVSLTTELIFFKKQNFGIYDWTL